ncbi:DUF6440 family protein [Butyrivibrio sp. AE3004]|uniref:DUF6440 family protein n=1 Tax=Butyrivibrio sp. AE3004 TaxID=1506994 RepID=UPI0004946640|nr:DUF6440 family protein [Butyrivibrio sp. AE3004]
MFGSNNSEKRFEHHSISIDSCESGAFSNTISGEIIIDRTTGVNYLFVMGGTDKAGLTVLVDENGKPLVTKFDD